MSTDSDSPEVTRTAASSDYWGDETSARTASSSSQLWGGRSADGSPMVVTVEPRLPPPMIDKPDPPLVAIVADDFAEVERAVGELTDPGGPHFVGAGPATAPVGPPGLSAELKDVAPATAPGTFMAAWSLSARTKMQKAERARRRRKRLLRVLALLLLGVGAYAAYPYVHTQIVARSVAADLRPYVKGKGVDYAPAGGTFSVRLPNVPIRSDHPLTAASFPLTVATHAATVTGRDYKIVLLVADLPGGTLPKGALGALKDPKIGGTGMLTGVHTAALAGETASVGTFVSSDALPRRVAVVVHRARVYVIRVQAQSVGAVFDTLTKSFRFTQPS